MKCGTNEQEAEKQEKKIIRHKTISAGATAKMKRILNIPIQIQNKEKLENNIRMHCTHTHTHTNTINNKAALREWQYLWNV